MIVFFAMAAAVWGIGAIMHIPSQNRWVMIAVLVVAMMTMTVVLPATHPLRIAAGEDIRFWLMLLGFGALVFGYTQLLGYFRNRAQRAVHRDDGDLPIKTVDQTNDALSPEALERYAPHIMMREIGGVGQVKLSHAKVLVIGAGGLGCPALMYLGAAGIGEIGIIDDDVVDRSNLQRQVLFGEADIGQPKVSVAAKRLQLQNPHIHIRTYQARAGDGVFGADLMAEYDLILDGTDTDEARYAINRAAIAAGKPLLSAAISQWEGQISLYHPAHDGPCYRCVFPKAAAPGVAPSCAEAGVLGPLPGVMGAMMASEAIKWVTQAGEQLIGRIFIYDAFTSDQRIIKARRDPNCPDCASIHTS